MPSPVGHALAGLAAGCLAVGRAGPSGDRRSVAPVGVRALGSDRRLWLFASLGLLADIDFLFGVHSAYTHSLGATAVVGGVAALLGRVHGPRFVVAVALAYGTHVVLDWLGSDSVEPIGVMALWPLTTEYYLSEHYWFMSVCRDYRAMTCWSHNLLGVVRETLLLGPLVAIALYQWARPSSRA